MPTLIYHAGALGDFVTTLPTIRRLRQHRPDQHLTFLGPKKHGELGRQHGYFDAVWDLDAAGTAALFSTPPSHQALSRLADFETALIFASDDSPVLTAVKSAGTSEILHQPPFPSDHTHVVDYHLSLLDGTCSQSPDPTMRIPQLGMRASSTSSPPIAAIHPGSGSRVKNWPHERFLAVADDLRSTGMRIFWVLGPAELDLRVPTQDEVVRDTPLPELCRRLSTCHIYVGNDSGVTHLAAATGCPTGAIFGPSDPAVWAPRGLAVKVLHHPCEKGACHQCSVREMACEGECLTATTVDEVITACRSLRVRDDLF